MNDTSKPIKIAIQGVRGSFHHQVAQSFFTSDVGVEECMSFPALMEALESDIVTDAVMAIENSIAGAILPNYALLDQYQVTIEGEFYLDVCHNLMALPEQSIEDLHEVWSHPMALLQCRQFFRKHPHIKLVEAADTAEVAREIQEKKILGIGAIASKAASKIYDLPIIASAIQTIQNNATRFFIINKDGRQAQQDIDKASVRFCTDHKRGSLATVLNVMSDCKLNLTKIQSMPVIETPWQYAFFVDVTFNDYADFAKAKKILPLMVNDFKVLGEYKNQKL